MNDYMIIRNRRYDLMLYRWRLLNGRVDCDPEIYPAALDWIESELALMPS